MTGDDEVTAPTVTSKCTAVYKMGITRHKSYMYTVYLPLQSVTNLVEGHQRWGRQITDYLPTYRRSVPLGSLGPQYFSSRTSAG